MEENKVTISLEDYLIMHDTVRDLRRIIDNIIDYLLLNSKLEKDELILTYDGQNRIMKDIVYKNYPAKYNKKLEEQKKEEE